MIASPSVRADSNGVARVKLAGGGKWFVEFIHITKCKESVPQYRL
jgi:hypothetical protein